MIVRAGYNLGWKEFIMSTTDTSISIRSQPRLLQSSVIGAIVGVILFVGCWLLAVTPFNATHSLIRLFTTTEITSITALVQGVGWSLIFGAWLGFLISLVSRFVAKT
jgi:hypothetical protein